MDKTYSSEFLTGAAAIKASIYAPGWRVLRGSTDVYQTTVSNAVEAFGGFSRNLLYCSTDNVRHSFDQGKQLKGCNTINTMSSGEFGASSFKSARELEDCSAVNADEAFSYITEGARLVAQGGDYAFKSVRDSQDLVAIKTNFAFISHPNGNRGRPEGANITRAVVSGCEDAFRFLGEHSKHEYRKGFTDSRMRKAQDGRWKYIGKQTQPRRQRDTNIPLWARDMLA